ncbi:PQQ-binding-like beta-propeller repeat protein [Georgenia phoenicis]|uniref:outer membrane protein assembly factor BamB family protein n=1 Tax=unclassified Georgenia TaxID=2626815 RepID=UPI0039AE973D
MDNSVVGRRSLWGLVVAIVVVLVAGTVLPLTPGESVDARVIRVFSAVSVAIALLVAVRARTHALDWELPRPRLGRTVVAAVLALVPALGNGYLTLAQLRSGLTPAAGLVTTLGAAAGLGTVLVLGLRRTEDDDEPAAGPADAPSSATWRTALPAGAVAVALALAASAAPFAAEAALVDGTPADAPVVEATPPAALGRATWTYEVGGRVDAAPVAGGLALATDDSGVVMLDGVTGEERWSYQRSGSSVASLVPADGGRLLVVVHDHPSAGPWEPAWTWTVLDAATGQVVTGPHDQSLWWPKSVPGRVGDRAAVVGDVALVAGHADRTAVRTAYSLRDGAQLWSCPVADCNNVVITEDAVVVTAGNRLRSLDPRTGEERWVVERPGRCELREPALDSGVLVAWCDGASEVVGLDSVDGAELWTLEIRPGDFAYLFTSRGVVNIHDVQPRPEVPELLDHRSGERLDGGVVLAVDVRTGEPLVQVQQTEYVSTRAGDTLIVTNDNDEYALAAYDLASGESTSLTAPWSAEGPHPLAPADGNLEVWDELCVDLADGTHCAVAFDSLHVASLSVDGDLHVQRWSDLGVPDGLRAGPGLRAPTNDHAHLLTVPGATVLAASVRGTDGERQVLVGLAP